VGCEPASRGLFEPPPVVEVDEGAPAVPLDLGADSAVLDTGWVDVGLDGAVEMGVLVDARLEDAAPLGADVGADVGTVPENCEPDPRVRSPLPPIEGVPTECVWSDEVGRDGRAWTEVFDEMGRSTLLTTDEGGDGIVEQAIHREYDDEGRLSEMVNYIMADGALSGYARTEYDRNEAGQEVESRKYSSENGVPYYWVRTEYDVEGRVLRRTQEHHSGQRISVTFSVFEYDACGLLVSVTDSDDTVVEYRFDGRVVTQHPQHPPYINSGSWSSRTVYAQSGRPEVVESRDEERVVSVGRYGYGPLWETLTLELDYERDGEVDERHRQVLLPNGFEVYKSIRSRGGWLDFQVNVECYPVRHPHVWRQLSPAGRLFIAP
jgi:hypothetical protein